MMMMVDIVVDNVHENPFCLQWPQNAHVFTCISHSLSAWQWHFLNLRILQVNAQTKIFGKAVRAWLMAEISWSRPAVFVQCPTQGQFFIFLEQNAQNAETKKSKILPKGSTSLTASDTWPRLAKADQQCLSSVQFRGSLSFPGTVEKVERKRLLKKKKLSKAVQAWQHLTHGRD